MNGDAASVLMSPRVKMLSAMIAGLLRELKSTARQERDSYANEVAAQLCSCIRALTARAHSDGIALARAEAESRRGAELLESAQYKAALFEMFTTVPRIFH